MGHLVVIAFDRFVFVGIVLLVGVSKVFGVIDADDFVSFSMYYQNFAVESYDLRLVVEVLLYDVAHTPEEIC